MSEQESCFHCGELIANNEPVLFAQLDQEQKKVCCHGCKAISEHIYQSGLHGYYQYRTELGNKPTDIDMSAYEVYDQSEYLGLISDELESGFNRITLSIDNIHCAACAWLIEQSIAPVPGIAKVTVNTVSERATIDWDQNQISLSNILATLNKTGYPSAPFSVSDSEKAVKRQEKQYIKRLGVAGLFTMQVMMLAFAMYFGAFSNMEAHQTGYFKWISFALSLPVIFYSALPFLQGAFTAIKSRHLSMDVSVSVAIYGAFIVSFYQLIKYGSDGNKGEVYFESISMFTLLLLIGKYLEFKAKSRAILSNANLNKSLPIFANRFERGAVSSVLLQKIKKGDIVVVKPGEQFAIDGIIIEGATTVNESVLTGEFEPVVKDTNDTVLAGSVNNEGNIKVEVLNTGANTTLAHIGQLQEDFAKHRPKFSQFADKIAHYFVIGQLSVAVLTYFIWLYVNPADAIWISLSVLVATCPCALSLATPTAYTCILSRLNKNGILVKNAEAFEQLTEITDVAFDKTGTLTTGQFNLDQTTSILSQHYDTKLSQAIYLLQQHSEHPIAKAFTRSSLGIDNQPLPTIELTNITTEVGKGISGQFDGATLKVGTAEYAGYGNAHTQPQHTDPSTPATDHNVWVSYNHEVCAQFHVSDNLKSNSKVTIEQLAEMGLTTHLLTGDPSASGPQIAQQLGFEHVVSGAKPIAKAEYVVSLQAEKKQLLMVGDGINDAPVFGAANVSIAMSSGADMTKQSADIIVLNNSLDAILKLFKAAKETKKTIRNNLYWSLVYNVVILPIAMLGWVPPYIAVIGMSASSILVVTNSLKLLRDK